MWPNPNLSTNRFIIIWPTIQTHCMRACVRLRARFFSGVFFSAQCNKTNRCKMRVLLYALACNHQMMMRNARGRITWVCAYCMRTSQRTHSTNTWKWLEITKKRTLTHSRAFWSVWKQSRFDLIPTQHRQCMHALTRIQSLVRVFAEKWRFGQCQMHTILWTPK